MTPLFFVHIPKTAGTSFRLGAERYFGTERITYDYGNSSSATSDLVKDFLYGDVADFWGFAEQCRQQAVAMVGGHVNIGRFVSLFGINSTVTFLRDPLQRMASEYSHFVRHYAYKGDFRDFYSRPVMHNRQSKILHGVSSEAIGMIGITERYAESLELLNAHYGIDIPHREDNQGKARLDAAHELSEEDISELTRLNARDIALYEHSIRLFDTRMALFRDSLPYAHAHLVEANAQRIAGWAWWACGDDSPVEVEVWVNDQLRDKVAATELRPGLCRFMVPRGGYIGFHLPLKLESGDRVQCRVAKTGQPFPPRPIQVERPTDK